MTDNVVQFPRMSSSPQTIEEVQQAVDNIGIYHVDETIGPVVGVLIDTLAVAGFDMDADLISKDMAFLYTSLRSMMLKMRHVEHPFQQVAEETFVQNDEGEVLFKIGGHPVFAQQIREESE